MASKKIDNKLIQRGVKLAEKLETHEQRGQVLTWEVAQWAYDVGPVNSEMGNSATVRKRLAAARQEVVALASVDANAGTCFPQIETLRNYRYAVPAVLPMHREYVSVKAGIALYAAEPFERERIINTLLDRGETITVDAVKDTLTEMRSIGAAGETAEWRWENVVDLAHDELEQIVEEYELDVNVDDYDDDNGFRNAIADALGIPSDDDREDDGEADAEDEEELTWEGITVLKRNQVDGLIVKYELDIDRTKAAGMKINELRRKVARALGIKVPALQRKVAAIEGDEAITIERWKSATNQEQQAWLKQDDGVTFNQVNDNIGWAKWSWNPMTGCLHGCEYCYADEIATRFYDWGFEPAWIPGRIAAPQHTKIPKQHADDPEWRRVFTCSMADLFGKWVPEAWIKAVFEQIEAAPQFEYLMLTKFPQRLAQFEWPDNVWAGTTVDTQARVKNAQRSFAKVTAGIRWLSCEPMKERLVFDDLSMFEWVVIGSQTAANGQSSFAPPFEWVADLYQQARAAGCKVYLKHNLVGPTADNKHRDRVNLLPGMQPIHEWPR